MKNVSRKSILSTPFIRGVIEDVSNGSLTMDEGIDEITELLGKHAGTGFWLGVLSAGVVSMFIFSLL
jgi:hypothetical protein